MQTPRKVVGVGRKPRKNKNQKPTKPKTMKSNPKNEITNQPLSPMQISEQMMEIRMHLRSVREACDLIEKSLKPTEHTFLTREEFKHLCEQIEVSGEIMKKDFPNLY